VAISPASDLILDVARAADPRQAMATTKVLVGASGDVSGDFVAALDRLPSSAALPSGMSYKNPVAALTEKQTPARKAEIGLESMLLKSMIDEMLPREASDVYGSGVAGDVWKSMLSDQIAEQIAKSGALKIGERLFATHQNLLQSKKHGWTGA
jgi:Rod binding domain-containing protein